MDSIRRYFSAGRAGCQVSNKWVYTIHAIDAEFISLDSTKVGYFAKIRVNRDMPQSLDMPASTTINMKMKTETMTVALSFTMRSSPVN